MIGFSADIQLSMGEDEGVKLLLAKYGWKPKKWGGAVTGGYEGPITVDGAEISAHLCYGTGLPDLILESTSPGTETALKQTELRPYVDRSKIRKIASLFLEGAAIEQALRKLRAHGWKDEPELGGRWDVPKRYHELTTFNIQGKEFRAQGLGPTAGDFLELTLYSADPNAERAVKESDMIEFHPQVKFSRLPF